MPITQDRLIFALQTAEKFARFNEQLRAYLSQIPYERMTNVELYNTMQSFLTANIPPMEEVIALTKELGYFTPQKIRDNERRRARKALRHERGHGYDSGQSAYQPWAEPSPEPHPEPSPEPHPEPCPEPRPSLMPPEPPPSLSDLLGPAERGAV